LFESNTQMIWWYHHVVPNYQLHLCIGMVFGEIKQSKIYAKFGGNSCNKVFKKQKIIPWLTEHDDVINITALPAPGAAFSVRARGGRLCSYATGPHISAMRFPISVYEPTQHPQDLGKSTKSCNHWGTQRVIAVYTRDSSTPYSCRTNHQFITPAGTNGFSSSDGIWCEGVCCGIPASFSRKRYLSTCNWLVLLWQLLIRVFVIFSRGLKESAVNFRSGNISIVVLWHFGVRNLIVYRRFVEIPHSLRVNWLIYFFLFLGTLVIQKGDITFDITKQELAFMKPTQKETALRTVLTVHSLMVRTVLTVHSLMVAMICGRLYMISENTNWMSKHSKIKEVIPRNNQLKKQSIWRKR